MALSHPLLGLRREPRGWSRVVGLLSRNKAIKRTTRSFKVRIRNSVCISAVRSDATTPLPGMRVTTVREEPD